MSDGSRRFTDREVALVLKQASEYEVDGGGAERGLSLGDLHEIAREVGISERAIEQAVAGLDRPSSLHSPVSGAPLVHKAARAVPSMLTDEAIARLIRVADERVAGTGSVAEALGSIRWTASERLRSTAVSISRSEGETSISVVEKTPPRLRHIFHFVPPAWALMIAAPSIGALQLSAPATGAALVGAILAGAGVGRAAWKLLSRRSEKRVRELADALTAEGHDAVRSGLVVPGTTDPE